jgi:hypothetical protein
MDEGYGYYPDEGGLYTAGLLTGGGLKGFRQGIGGPSVPSLTWGIKKLQREGTGQRLKNTKWWGFMQKALEQARQEYLASMTDAERAKYLESKRKQLAQKERKRAKIELVRAALEKLKGNTVEETAKNIAEALKIEGNPKTRVLRAALTVLYLALKDKDDEGRMKVRQFKFKGLVKVPRKKYKGRSYIGFDNPVTINREAINQKIEELEEQLEKLEELKEKAAPKAPIVEMLEPESAAPKAPPTVPPKAPPKAGARKGRPAKSAIPGILAKK